MTKERVVWVNADPETEAREKAKLRGREAVRRLAAAEKEYEQAMVEVDRHLGPDPRRIVDPRDVAEQAIQSFCDQIVGRPSIPST